MDNLTYNNLAKRIKRPGHSRPELRPDGDIGLKDLGPKDAVQAEKLAHALCNDLKRLLDAEGHQSLAEGLLLVQHDLESLHEQVSLSSLTAEQEFPNLDRLYRNMTPLLLRTLASESEPEKVAKDWKEAIRVAIEEEIYQWQEASASEAN